MTDFEARIGALCILVEKLPINRVTKLEDARQLITDLRYSLKQNDKTARKMFGTLSQENAERVLNELEENVMYYVCEGRPLPPLMVGGDHNSDRASAS